jgi:hypothetical protein
MPLEKGSSKKVISKNVGELVKSYEKKGKIGTSHPKSKKKALKQAEAIAYAEAGKGKKKKKQVNENFLLGFIKSLVDDDFKKADKCLQNEVDKIVTNKIKKVVTAIK